MAFSAALVLNSRIGLSRKRVSRFHNVKVYLQALARELFGRVWLRAAWIWLLLDRFQDRLRLLLAQSVSEFHYA
jgi:hypothetical protein